MEFEKIILQGSGMLVGCYHICSNYHSTTVQCKVYIHTYILGSCSCTKTTRKFKMTTTTILLLMNTSYIIRISYLSITKFAHVCLLLQRITYVSMRTS